MLAESAFSSSMIKTFMMNFRFYDLRNKDAPEICRNSVVGIRITSTTDLLQNFLLLLYTNVQNAPHEVIINFFGPAFICFGRMSAAWAGLLFLASQKQ